MPSTTVDLYRAGNASEPRMDNVRPQDIETFEVEGQVWVRAGTGGISTFTSRGTRPGHWWRLDAGYEHAAALIVWNDHGSHWSWEPVQDMPLDRYVRHLRATHDAFYRV